MRSLNGCHVGTADRLKAAVAILFRGSSKIVALYNDNKFEELSV
jgi:hypothetical protein